MHCPTTSTRCLIILLSLVIFPALRTPLWAKTPEIRFEQVLELGVQTTGVVQDKEGFIWIATSNGLKRFDGLEVKTWRKEEGSLSEDFIRAMCDTDEALWLLTNTQGLNRYDKTTGRFKHYKHDPDNPNSLRGAGGFALLADREGYIWAGTENGVLSRLDPRTDGFIHFTHDPGNKNSLPPGMITTIYQDSKGLFWIGSEGGGLTRFDLETRTFTNFRHDPTDATTLSGNRINVVLEDGKGFLWVGTGTSGLNRFDPSTGRAVRYQHDRNEPASLSSNSVMALCADGGDYLWVGTIFGGLNRLDKRTGIFERYLSDPKSPSVNKTKVIQLIFIDRSNILWVLSRPGTVLKHVRTTKGFSLYRHDPNRPGSLSSNTVLPIYEDRQGTVWIGTGNGGLNRYNREDDSFEAYKHDPQDPDSLPAPGVFSMAEDALGTFWVGASDASRGTLCIFDRKTKKVLKTFRHDPVDPTSIANNRFLLDIHPDKLNPHILWLAIAFGGLEKFDTEKETFTHYPGYPDDPARLAGSYINIHQDNDGVLWLGGNYGLDRFDPKSETVTRFRHDPDRADSLIEDNVSVILEGRSGILWLGTAGGLERFDPKAGNFTHYTSKEGLPDNNVLGVLEDDRGNIWMGTGSGIVRFDPLGETFRLYTESDGLQGNAFYWFSDCRTSKGEMWFAGFKGANRFFPDEIKDNPHLPRIALTSVKQGGEEVFFGREPARLKEINLDWRNNYFEFEVAALEFTNPGKNRYKYMLEGVDETWYQAGTRRFGKYTNLPGGAHVLKIMGSNNDGLWNPEALSLMVNVARPPWRTWWAYGLYLLAAAGLVFTFLRYQRIRLDQERKTADGLRKINRVKDEILANTSHELRTPLNGIIGLGESLLDGAAGDLPSEAHKNLKMIVASGLRMISLVNDILDFSKLNRKNLGLKRRPLDIRTMVDIVIEISRSLAGGKGLGIVNEIPPGGPAVLADEDMVQQILHNLIGNAIKFTDQGRITVSATPEEGFLVVHVADTGAGIPKDQFGQIFEPFEQVDGSTERAHGGTGLGLAITKKLVELHQGSIGVDSVVGQGSDFWFSLPIAGQEAESGPLEDRLSQTRIARLMDTWSEEAAETGPAASEKEEVEPGGSGYRILVVDDDPVNLHVLVNQLTVQNFLVSQAVDGEAALAAIEEAEGSGQGFDLVLLDVMMPKMSGYEVCRRIRERYSLDDLPVVMLTAKNQVADLVAGFESGANDYLPKPFSKSELLARIKNQVTIKDLARRRLRAEEELRTRNKELYQASAYLEAVIDNANVWLNVLDRDGNVVIWNKAAEEISGYSRDEVTGHNKIWEWAYPDPEYRQKMFTTAGNIIERHQEIQNFETTIRAKDKKSKVISWHSRNLTDEKDQPIGSIAFGRDITSTKILEAQLAQAQKMEAVGTLASGIAHDFNNILAAITGYSELALEYLLKGRRTEKEIRQILKAADRAKVLVQQILAFSRKADLKRTPQDLNALIAGTVPIIERTIPKMISIELELDPDLGIINGDSNRIEQIILNLASNAKDAMPDGGRLILKTGNLKVGDELDEDRPEIAPGDYVELTVTDTGQGIDEDAREHIFEPFYTTKEIGRGTGLGLASVYGTVTNHDGHIICKSGPHEGTTFEILFPRLEAVAKTREHPSPISEFQSGGDETILVVDDEEAIRELGAEILANAGYETITADSGEKALAVYGPKWAEIDLVILDLSMPGMGGESCFRELAKINPRVRVIVASGYSGRAPLDGNADSRDYAYIAKPYKISELLRTVREVLDG